MRPLEVALVVLVALAAVRPLLRLGAGRIVAAVLAAGAVAAALVQAAVEAPRWQLVPLWVAVLGVVVLAVRELVRPDLEVARASAAATHARATPHPQAATDPDELTAEPVAVATEPDTITAAPPPPRRRRRTYAVPLLVLTAVGAGLAWSLPVVTLPETTGPFEVGTAISFVVDAERTEIYGPDPGGPRVLPVQVWYPTDGGADAPRTPWLYQRGEVTAAAARDVGLPGFTLDHLALVSSRSVADAPLGGREQLPVVLYAHGWNGFREIHAVQLEELASHGYLVIAADHAYGAIATELPGGELAELDPDALPVGAPRGTYDEAASQLIATFADDLESILDALFDGDLLGSRLAPERISDAPLALIGHSAGGGAAILACSRLRRCAAVVGYDPWVAPVPDEVVGADLEVPLLSIRSEEWVDTDNDVRLRRLHAGSSAAEGRVAVAGIRHRDLTMLPLLSPLGSPLGINGPLADEQTLEALDLWTLSFLDHHLRGVGGDPLRWPPAPQRTVLENASS